MAPLRDDPSKDSKSLKQSGSFLVRVSVESGADGDEVRFFVRNLGDGREERLRDPGLLPDRLLDQLASPSSGESPPIARVETRRPTERA
jgi:hypothetical protein